MEILKQEWEISYKRKENFLFYPYEETVKFLNRFVRKRRGLKKFETILQSNNNELKGLDLGCGIGRQAILLEEFGIEAYGLDISEEAISNARKLADFFGFSNLKNRFLVYNGKEFLLIIIIFMCLFLVGCWIL